MTTGSGSVSVSGSGSKETLIEAIPTPIPIPVGELMEATARELTCRTTAGTDVVDLSAAVEQVVQQAGVGNGALTLFVPGSTAALTTIEYESGVIQDLKDAVARMAPEGIPYLHDERWGDGNGYAHVRAALIGPSLHIPIVNGRLTLGTWQQIVLLDFDNRPRERRVVAQLVGA